MFVTTFGTTSKFEKFNLATSGVTRSKFGCSIKFLKLSKEPIDSSDSQFAPAECGDTKLLIIKDLQEVIKKEQVGFVLRNS
jgi:hypothetical protein